MKGKYSRNHKRFNSRFVALLSSLVLILGLAAGATIAYLADDTDAVVNTFTPGKSDIVIVETFNGNVKSNVKITVKEGSVASYVRARVIINWVDGEGNILSGKPAGDKYMESVIMGSTDNWQLVDGYYYHKGAVTAGDSTSVLITEAKYGVPTGAAEHLQIEILAESIQAEPAAAVIDAWGNGAAVAVGAVSAS